MGANPVLARVSPRRGSKIWREAAAIPYVILSCRSMSEMPSVGEDWQLQPLLVVDRLFGEFSVSYLCSWFMSWRTCFRLLCVMCDWL